MNKCKKYILQLVDQYSNTFYNRKGIFKNLYKIKLNISDIKKNSLPLSNELAKLSLSL